MKQSKKLKKAIKEKELEKIPIEQVPILQKEYEKELEENPEYSLVVNAEGKYDMSEEQKKFVEYYVQFKSVSTACDLLGIEREVGLNYFVAYSTQQEIRRINRALYHRQFSQKMLDLDQIGGFLSSLVTDENVPLASQLNNVDKLKVINMIMEVMKLKKEALIDPEPLMKNNDISLEIKNLSINTLQNMLNNINKTNKDQDEIVIEESLTPEEKAYLETLPTEDLLKILEETSEDKHE